MLFENYGKTHLAKPTGMEHTVDENDPCPECGHRLGLHNDAGTFGGGQGRMRCYFNDSGQQFHGSGEPVTTCNCTYSGPGTEKFY